MSNAINFTELQQQQRNYGNLQPFCFRNNQPRFALGPHYFISLPTIVITAGLIAYVLITLSGSIQIYWFAIGLTSAILYILAYLNVAFSNPGIASQSLEPDITTKANSRYCQKCKVVRQSKVVHCSDCDVCIFGHDHHCPWTGKCIGGNNLWSFYLFLGFTLANMIILLLAAIAGKKH